MLNALLGDAIARVAILLWTATAISLAVPILPAAWMQTLSTYLLDIPALTVAIAAVAKGLPKIADESERRCWRLLGMGCVAWLAVSLPYAALAPGGHWSLGWKVYGDLVYVVGYLGLILAIEVQPHRLQTGTLGDQAGIGSVDQDHGDARIGAAAQQPLNAKVATFLSLAASLNLFLFLFNLLPILPLDGGHVVGAGYEAVRRKVAKVRGRPDPGPVDMARLLPVAYIVAGVLVSMSVVVIWADLVRPIALG